MLVGSDRRSWQAAVAMLVIGCVLSASGCAPSADEAGGESASTGVASTASPGLVDGAPCPLAADDLGLPEGSGCASSATGSFERGEALETLTVYANLDERRLPAGWRIRVERGSKVVVDESFGFGSEFSYPEVLGAENADAVGPDEAFIKVVTHSYHSGKTHEVGIFGLRNGHIFAVNADHEPLVFPVGGVSYEGWGAECRDVNRDGAPEFLVLRIDHVTDYVQTWSERIYRWRHRSLVFERENRGRSAKTGYLDPLLWRFYSLRCLEFNPPFPYARG